MRSIIIALLVWALQIQIAGAAIYGDKNDYVPADDEDIENDESIDEDLKGIIRRVIRIKIKKDDDYVEDLFSASAFVIGTNCDKIITAKHNSHFKSESMIKNLKVVKKDAKIGDYMHLHRNLVTEIGGKTYDILVPKGNIGTWRTSSEGIVHKLRSGIKTMENCNDTPIVTRQEISTFSNCRIIGFPLIRGSTTFSSIPKEKGRYHASKRGMAACKILRHEKSGLIVTNCDTLPGASGGPIVCKVGEAWKYVGTNNGGMCMKNDVYNYPACFDPDKGQEIVIDVKGGNLIFGTAGSFATNKPRVYGFKKPSIRQINSGKSPDTVKEVQIKLNAIGYYVGAPDGIAGKKTRKAIEDFQEVKGLRITGEINQVVLDKLNVYR